MPARVSPGFCVLEHFGTLSVTSRQRGCVELEMSYLRHGTNHQTHAQHGVGDFPTCVPGRLGNPSFKMDGEAPVVVDSLRLHSLFE